MLWINVFSLSSDVVSDLVDMRPDSLCHITDDSLSETKARDDDEMDSALSPELTSGDIVKMVTGWKT